MTANYSIHRTVREATDIFRLQQRDFAYAHVAPDWGNNCFEFYTYAPVLEPVEFEEFSRRPRSYGIPILFPYPNRIKDGTFSYAGKMYHVDPKQHGYVRDKKWDVIDSGASDAEGAWIVSSFDARNYPDEILKQFPFPFRMEVLYRLREGTLTMETTVHNIGPHILPFGFGIHPYFRLPQSGTLCIPAEKRWELADSIPTGRKLDVNGQYDLRQSRDVHSLQLDDIFTDLKTGSAGAIRCILQDDAVGVRTIVEFDSQQFPEVVVYTPPAPRSAICIEPYTSPTDAFNLVNAGISANLIELQPNADLKFRIAIHTQRVVRA